MVITVNTADKNNQMDADILQCKADILRARDIIPPFNIKPKEPQTVKQAHAKADSEDTDVISPEEQPNKPHVPKFDLAEQIMTQQRKVTAIKRKSPIQTVEFQKPKQQTRVEMHIGPIPVISYRQEQAITNIVARDIKRLRQ
jgi:hypothetical protein